MSIYKKTWWEKLRKKSSTQKIDILHDIEAIKEFLGDVNLDSKRLLKQLDLIEEFEKERKVGRKEIKKIASQTEEKTLTEFSKQYGFFQNDVILNGVRVRMIKEQFDKEVFDEE